jgi:PAS domain S-box-containing protein
MWSGHDFSRVTATLLDVLLRLLELDFAYAQIPDPSNELPREWIRCADTSNHHPEAHNVGRALEPYLSHRTPSKGLRIANPVANGTVSIAVFDLGVQNKVGVFVAASRRSEFPTETESLLMQVATNQATVALQEGRRLAQRVQEQVTQELKQNAFYLAEGQRLSHSGSWSFLPSGICDFWSEELFQILGFDPAEGIPTIADYLNLVHPEDRGLVEATINQMVAEGIGCDVKKRIIRADGGLRVVRCVGTPVHENGVVTRFIGTLMDVTDQERMVQELRRREVYLAEAQRLNHTGSFGWDVSSGEVYWSEETFRIFEYDQATCKPTVDLVLQRVHADDLPLVQQTVDHASKGNDFDLEHRMLMPDGSVKHLHVVAHATRDELGRVECIGAVTDVTATKVMQAAHKHAEDEMRAARARFEGILEIADDAIISVDSNQRILLFNQGAEKVFGHMQAEVVGKPLALLLPERSEDVHRKHIEDFARSPDVARTMGQRREVFGRRKDGHEFPAEASISKLDLGGRQVFTVILRDITERRKTEQRLVAQHTVTQALAEAATLEEATPRILQTVCECLAWDLGELWRIDRPAGVLRCVEVWHKESTEAPQFVAISRDKTFRPGIGLPGRVWSSREPVYIPDVVQDANFPRSSIALREGLHAALAFPILLGSEVVGVMDFFSQEIRQPDPNLLDMMGTIGSQIGQFIERKRAEADLQKAFEEIKKLRDQLYKENIALREEVDKASMFEDIVGESPALQAVLERVAKVAPTDSTVLISGETGTGKELVARAIHKRSQRWSRAFVTVNCAAVPATLIASELFGHEKGAFTGALQRHLGRFELAEGGTIFLDEIGELPAETQVALLRVLQEREFERVGGSQPIRADVRVIAATNRDLESAIADGTFRTDLFYRLDVFPIEIPPLRERREDIATLVEYFIHRYSRKAGKKIETIEKRTLELLESYAWPGNIRELQNVIERSVIVCETNRFSVDPRWLSFESSSSLQEGQPIPKKSAAEERKAIENVLAATGGRVSGPSGAAVQLNMPAPTLESKIRSLKINKFRYKKV